jgi:uncharacterized membrane protein
MFTLVRASLTNASLAIQQILAFGVAFLVAEAFYKFGSFGLELAAFLATWWVADAAITLATKWAAKVRMKKGRRELP